jgi:hypothetical protein
MAHQSPAGQGTRVRVAPAGAPPTPPSSSPPCGSRAEESTGVMGAVCSMTQNMYLLHYRPISTTESRQQRGPRAGVPCSQGVQGRVASTVRHRWYRCHKARVLCCRGRSSCCPESDPPVMRARRCSGRQDARRRHANDICSRAMRKLLPDSGDVRYTAGEGTCQPLGT